MAVEQYASSENLDARIVLHERFSTNRYGWGRWVFDQLRVPPRSTILELGCGTGSLWSRNIDRIPEDWTVVLSDLSAGMLERARTELSQGGKVFAFGRIDAQSIAMQDGTVDVVVANHVLYHVSDRPRAYSEIRRVLRPGGQLYAATNGKTASAGIPELVQRVKPDAYDEVPETRTLFSLENGAGELSRWFAGVEVLQYEDSFLVTEAQPLIDYVASTQRLNEDELARFGALVMAEISRSSEIRIPKNSGMFRARKTS